MLLANSLLENLDNNRLIGPHFPDPPYGIELDIHKTITAQYSLQKATQA
jgi:hypothetical protein